MQARDVTWSQLCGQMDDSSSCSAGKIHKRRLDAQRLFFYRSSDVYKRQALWIAPLVRGKIPEDVMTIPDLMEYLYNRKAKVFSTIAVLAGVLYNGANITVISQLLALMFDMPTVISVVVSGIIVGIYVLASGMWSVTMTDTFQLGFISFSVGIGVIMVMNMTGGWDAIFSSQMCIRDRC